MMGDEALGAFETLRVSLAGATATVALARPAVHNAFDPRMIAELTGAFQELGRAPGVRAVVLRGDGPSFSAGADLEWMRSVAKQGAEENHADALRLADMFAAVQACPRPVVARVHGAAIGGGVGLVAACDIAIADEDARFAFSEARLGILPAVISPFVVQKIGAGTARELFLTGERFDGRRAARIGLVSRAVAADEIDAAVEERLTELLAAGPEAQAAVKKLIAGICPMPEGTRELTAELIASRRASEEGREGMAAFLERRKPRWVGAEPSASPRASARSGGDSI